MFLNTQFVAQTATVAISHILSLLSNLDYRLFESCDISPNRLFAFFFCYLRASNYLLRLLVLLLERVWRANSSVASRVSAEWSFDEENRQESHL